MMDIGKWLEESLQKIHNTPPDELIATMEEYGLVKHEENIDETTEAD